MSSRSPEYEKEVVRTLRLVRGLIYAGMAIVGAFALLGVLGFVVNVSRGGTRMTTSGGGDVHAPLRAGISLANTTGAGLSSRVALLTVERGATLTVTARAQGMDSTATLPETWKLYFTDNTQQPMQVERLSTAGDGVTIRASLEVPPGKTVQFLHVDPDASYGDMYFDIPPG